MRTVVASIAPATLITILSAVCFTGDAQARPPAAAAQEADRDAHIASSSAAVEIRTTRNGPWQAASSRTAVPAYAQVRSLQSEASLVLPGAGTLELGAHSSVSTWGPTTVDATGGQPLSAFRVELRAGEVMMEVPRSKGARSALVCAGEAMILVEPGSIARARLQSDGTMSVAVYEGKARISTQGIWRALASSSGATLRPRIPLAAPHPVGPAPAWTAKQDVEGTGPLAVVFDEHGKAPLAVRWSDPAGSTGFIAELARDEAFADLVLKRELPASQSYLVTPPLGDGRYFARVRVRGADGLPGLTSASRPLRVARVVLPAGGSHRKGGEIALPPEQKARLADASGLEMRVGRVGFVSAPSAVGLSSEAPLSAFLRISGDPFAVPLKLVPRAEHAEIQLSPKTAVWPTDPVEIVAKLQGYSDSASIEPRFRVTVNMVEVPVDWWQRGRIWKGRIAPKHGEGPWVVRVEAKDDVGADLGRAHLEVISAAPRGRVASR